MSAINFFLFLLFCCLTYGKIYMRCDLFKELYNQNLFSRSFLSVWVCLIDHESNFNTAKFTEHPNGSAKYGLFQISSKDGCQKGRPGGACKQKCEDLLNGDLGINVDCAKTIFEIHGFKYWRGWTQFCNNTQNLPNLSILCNIP